MVTPMVLHKCNQSITKPLSTGYFRTGLEIDDQFSAEMEDEVPFFKNLLLSVYIWNRGEEGGKGGEGGEKFVL